MTLSAMLYSDDEDLDGRRLAARRPVGLSTTLRDEASRPHEVLVHDLSSDGCLVETEMCLAEGRVVSIGLAGVGRREAEVVRVDGARYGFRFGTPLSPAQLAYAFSGSTVVEGGFAPLPLAPGFPEPVVEKWHPALRLTLLVGLTSALWSAILHIA